MRKFLAVLKREYKKIVFTWTFVLSTLLGPVLLIGISLVPMLMFSIKGSALRIAIVDDSGKLASRIQENLSSEKQLENLKEKAAESFTNINVSQDEKIKNSAQQLGGNFAFENFKSDGKSPEKIRQELNERIQKETLDAYLLIPNDLDNADAKFEFFSRNSSDFITKELLENAVEDAVRSERLIKANISEEKLKEINQKIDFSVTKVTDKGEEKDSGFGYAIAFTLGLIIYMSLTLYGSVVMGAIIEEKETRIAEILFSSAKPIELMLGKLFGVGLASLTQLSIWGFSVLAVVATTAAVFGASGIPLPIPAIPPFFLIYVLIFFLLGFFIYATIYIIVGAMVTTAQEGQQFAFLPILLLLGGLYSIFPVIRDPNSSYSFWSSITPFISPLVMPVRIFTDTPPFWQILLAMVLNLVVIIALNWAAAKVYRIGMLMYGKRATIPEVWKWIWQS